MKLLVVSESYPPVLSGVAFFAEKLVKTMADRKVKTVLLTSGEDLGQKRFNVNDNLTIVRQTSVSNPFRNHHKVSIPTPWKLRSLVDEFQPDLIHFHDPGPTTLQMMWWTRDIPKLFTNHGTPTLVTSYFPFIKDKRQLDDMIWSYILWVENKCDYLTAPTETIRQLLIDKGLKIPSKAISYGIDLNEFYPPAKHQNKLKIRKKLGWPDGFILYYHGRVNPDKNVSLLIDVMDRLKSRYQKLRLVISGEDTLTRKVLKEKARIKGVSKLITWTDGKPENRLREYQAADCFIVPSKIETQSIVTLQALACGLAILAADMLALPELVKEGENGYLFNPNSSRDAAEKTAMILDLDDSRLEKFGKNSLELAKKHDQTETWNEYLKLYENLTGGGR